MVTALSQSDANSLVRAAWQAVWNGAPSDSEAAYTQAVAWLENQYGRAGQFNAMAARSQFNWGSLHAAGTPPNCPAGSAPGSDVGKVCFRVFPTDLLAATAFVRELTANQKYSRSRVKDAMTGTPEDVAQAMYTSKYFQGSGSTDAERVQGYANAIRSALKAIGQNAAIPSVQASPSSSLTRLALLAAAGYGAYWLFAKGGNHVVTAKIDGLASGARNLARRYT